MYYIIGAAVGFVILLAIFVCSIFYCKKKMKKFSLTDGVQVTMKNLELNDDCQLDKSTGGPGVINAFVNIFTADDE